MGRTKLESKLKNRILDLIESPELHAYLMEHAERLKLKDYVSIIAGAPISLGRKQELLHDMKRSSCLKKQEMDYVSLCCACMDRAVQFLTSETGTIFLIQLMGYDDKHKSDIMDGPYIMTSLANTKNAVKNYYREDMDEDADAEWKTLYWRVELYTASQDVNNGEDGFLSAEYTYILDKDGEVQYYIHEWNSSNHLNGSLGRMVEDQFFSVSPDLNLPVPYHPGDVLFIDCRPYAPGAFYCRLKEVGDDCCGIQCEYVDAEGNMETGALKHGDYFFNHREVEQYLSPLYRARIVSKYELSWDEIVRRSKNGNESR